MEKIAYFENVAIVAHKVTAHNKDEEKKKIIMKKRQENQKNEVKKLTQKKHSQENNTFLQIKKIEKNGFGRTEPNPFYTDPYPHILPKPQYAFPTVLSYFLTTDFFYTFNFYPTLNF